MCVYLSVCMCMSLCVCLSDCLSVPVCVCVAVCVFMCVKLLALFLFVFAIFIFERVYYKKGNKK